MPPVTATSAPRRAKSSGSAWPVKASTRRSTPAASFERCKGRDAAWAWGPKWKPNERRPRRAPAVRRLPTWCLLRCPISTGARPISVERARGSLTTSYDGVRHREEIGVDVRIGIIQAPRELEIELGGTARARGRARAGSRRRQQRRRVLWLDRQARTPHRRARGSHRLCRGRRATMPSGRLRRLIPHAGSGDARRSCEHPSSSDDSLFVTEGRRRQDRRRSCFPRAPRGRFAGSCPSFRDGAEGGPRRSQWRDLVITAEGGPAPGSR